MKTTSKTLSFLKLGIVGGAALLVVGCSNYVKRVDYDAAIAELRSRDSAIESKVDANTAAMNSLKQELAEKFAKYDKAIAEAQGRISVDAMAHFDYDSSDLRDEDKAALDDFARVIREHHAGSLITVEGFTDAAGGKGYNNKLGQKRADAVRDYLVSSGGLPDSTVRAVSYGEASNRQVAAGAWGAEGMPNRRVSLVVDRIGS